MFKLGLLTSSLAISKEASKDPVEPGLNSISKVDDCPEFRTNGSVGEFTKLKDAELFPDIKRDEMVRGSTPVFSISIDRTSSGKLPGGFTKPLKITSDLSAEITGDKPAAAGRRSVIEPDPYSEI